MVWPGSLGICTLYCLPPYSYVTLYATVRFSYVVCVLHWGTFCTWVLEPSMLLPTIAPPSAPSKVAAARPVPWPIWLPATPPTMPPRAAPAPDRGCCTDIGWSLQTWRATG